MVLWPRPKHGNWEPVELKKKIAHHILPFANQPWRIRIVYSFVIFNHASVAKVIMLMTWFLSEIIPVNDGLEDFFNAAPLNDDTQLIV